MNSTKVHSVLAFMLGTALGIAAAFQIHFTVGLVVSSLVCIVFAWAWNQPDKPKDS